MISLRHLIVAISPKSAFTTLIFVFRYFLIYILRTDYYLTWFLDHSFKRKICLILSFLARPRNPWSCPRPTSRRCCSSPPEELTLCIELRDVHRAPMIFLGVPHGFQIRWLLISGCASMNYYLKKSAILLPKFCYGLRESRMLRRANYSQRIFTSVQHDNFWGVLIYIYNRTHWKSKNYYFKLE